MQPHLQLPNSFIRYTTRYLVVCVQVAASGMYITCLPSCYAAHQNGLDIACNIHH